MDIMIQKLNLMRLRLFQILWKLQENLLRQNYLTMPFMKTDIDKNLKEMQQTREKIQKLQNQKTALLQSI